jgi:adenylate cyclase
MSGNRSLAQRIGRVLERVTRQSGRLPSTPAYGSLLLGRVSESQGRRRIRIQIIMTVLVLGANLIGIGAALILVIVAIPAPSIFDDAPAWITFGVSPAYIVLALTVGIYWITRRTVLALR